MLGLNIEKCLKNQACLFLNFIENKEAFDSAD